MRWPEDGMPLPTLTLQELMRLPRADRVVLTALARRLLEEDLPSAPGAWPRGAPVKKRNSPPGDFHPDGTAGKVFGSLAVPLDVREGFRRRASREVSFLYIVVWDGEHLPVAVLDDRIELAPEE